ncbi:MAG TPA: TetR/AcrR family transcriptional regulator [Acidimicrobiales bacterium]|nr:TetR/AcrR family transcriptional regulator [Acidimicrobiales bacterium]
MDDRRAELLAGATAWATENGLATLSLRPLAKALGTSDRMLLYWFGSRDGLLAAIAEHAGDALSLALPAVDPDAPPPSPRAWLDGCWALFTDPGIRPAMALLFELDALGARAPGPARDAARGVGDRWIGVVDDALAALGVAEPGRQPLTKVVAGALVGLALDALVRDGLTRPDAAFDVLADLIERAR